MGSETDAAGNKTSYTYGLDGNVATMTGPRGNSGNYPGRDFTLDYHYDDLNRLVRAELPPKEPGGANHKTKGFLNTWFTYPNH